MEAFPYVELSTVTPKGQDSASSAASAASGIFSNSMAASQPWRCITHVSVAHIVNLLSSLGTSITPGPPFTLAISNPDPPPLEESINAPG